MTTYNKNLTNKLLYKLFSNSPSDMYQLTTTNIMDGFYNNAMAPAANGIFKAVCLSGIRTGDNTGTGTDKSDGLISSDGNFILIVVRPLAPFGDILPDPRLSTTPEAINETISNHLVMWTAKSDFEFKDQIPISFGQVINCYFEDGSISNSDFRGLRFQEPVGETYDQSFVRLATIACPSTARAAFQSPATAAILGVDTASNSLLPKADATQMKLLDFIGTGEGSYNASNAGDMPGGGIGNQLSKTSWVTPGKGKGLATETRKRPNQQLLSTMTIGQIQELQQGKNPYHYPASRPVRTLFAAGKYQIVPLTMPSALRGAGLGSSDIFNKENQDKLALGLIYGTKRPDLRDYLKGSNSVTLDQAQTDFAKEWASVPVPSGGTAYNDGSNQSSHPVAAVRNVLKEVRKLNIQNGFTIK